MSPLRRPLGLLALLVCWALLASAAAAQEVVDLVSNAGETTTTPTEGRHVAQRFTVGDSGGFTITEALVNYADSTGDTLTRALTQKRTFGSNNKDLFGLTATKITSLSGANTTWETTAEASASAVDTAGEWHFSTSGVSRQLTVQKQAGGSKVLTINYEAEFVAHTSLALHRSGATPGSWVESFRGRATGGFSSFVPLHPVFVEPGASAWLYVGSQVTTSQAPGLATTKITASNTETSAHGWTLANDSKTATTRPQMASDWKDSDSLSVTIRGYPGAPPPRATRRLLSSMAGERNNIQDDQVAYQPFTTGSAPLGYTVGNVWLWLQTRRDRQKNFIQGPLTAKLWRDSDSCDVRDSSAVFMLM